ncbi:MAG: isochorismatase family protein [Verrucomicrobia bacterium]|nr:isochorismatase family protein [Verrucomicrobiota bacterium]MBI3870412.1 isochorismatase family protein [Verrucomicrobiota bacterium]
MDASPALSESVSLAKSALVLIDLQRDFLPHGAWEMPDSDAVIGLANRFQRRFRLVVATQDWHPKSHKIFASNHDKREIGQVIDFKRQLFKLAPVHCVQKTPGAELAPALVRDYIQKIFYRGQDSDLNGQSAFFDNDGRTSTGLAEFLRARNITDVYLMGFSHDGCVVKSATQAQSLAFQAHLIEDAIRSTPQTEQERQEDARTMAEAGVLRIASRNLL